MGVEVWVPEPKFGHEYVREGKDKGSVILHFAGTSVAGTAYKCGKYKYGYRCKHIPM